MTKFRMKGIIIEKDWMIHVLNYLPKECDVISDGLENHLTSTGPDALTTELLCNKLNHWHEKIKNKNEDKKEKSVSSLLQTIQG